MVARLQPKAWEPAERCCADRLSKAKRPKQLQLKRLDLCLASRYSPRRGAVAENAAFVLRKKWKKAYRKLQARCSCQQWRADDLDGWV